MLHSYPALAVSIETVRANFARYDLLDEQVVFLQGWFRDTLPTAPIEKLAILRLDGDLYESTMDALRALYDKVSAGGFVIVDDYGAFPNCRAWPISAASVGSRIQSTYRRHRCILAALVD